MNTQQLKQACLDRIEECFVIAEKEFNKSIPRVPVVFNDRMKTNGGTAETRKIGNTCVGVRITLNTNLLERNGQAFIDDVPGHEAAHIISAVVYGKRGVGHSPAWKSVMYIIGQEAARLHELEIDTSNRIPAYCGCNKTNYISKKRATFMRKGKSYSCRICSSMLTLAAPNSAEIKIAASKPSTPTKATGKKITKSSLVRKLILDNPNAGVEELVALVNASDIGVKKNLVRSYVKNNVVKLRG